ncbi:ABC transporter permease [Cryobacterium sp. Hz9]|nr:ABC transporter permease [Cryobacterium sp. Hz9]
MSVRERLTQVVAIDGLPVAAGLVLATVFFTMASPFFLTQENIANLLTQSVFIIILAAGMTFVLIVGGFDLSVGAATGLSAATTMLVLMNDGPLPLAVLAGVGTGMIFGIINGFVIAVMEINAFIVTLATLSIGAGALQVLTNSTQLTGVASPAFAWLTKGSILGIPSGVVITLIIVAVLEWMLLFTTFGRRVFAVGTNPRAAFLAGVSVRSLTFSVYLLSGTIAGLAGVLLASHLNSVQPGLGQGYELSAIAAAVLGGVSLAGGRGSVWRAVIGALFLATMAQGLQLIGVDPLWFSIVTGASIVIAVAFDRAVQKWVIKQLAAATRKRGVPAETDDLSSVSPAVPSTSGTRSSVRNTI